MKQSALAILASLALTACAGLAPAPNPDPAAKSQPTAMEQLTALDDEWLAAEVHHDRAALERILHEDFLVTYASGRTVDRATFIAEIMTSNLSPFTVIHSRIRITGDVAVVIDEAIDHTVKYTWIAIRSRGQWRIISETMVRVTPPK